MKIDRVSVRYGELRTTVGYNNVRHEVELSATLSPGETPREVRGELQKLTKQAVKMAFGYSSDNANQEDIPF